jgi:hypothetical protein
VSGKPTQALRTKILDKKTVEKASELATQEATSLVLQGVPKTAAGFEKDMKQLKKDEAKVVQYLLQIPASTMESLFKQSEISTDVLSQLLGALARGVVGDQTKTQQAADLLLALSKAANYDMSLMFLDDKEVAHIKTLLREMDSQLGKDSGVGEAIRKAYG